MKNEFTIVAVYSPSVKQLCFDLTVRLSYGEAEDEIPYLKLRYANRIRLGEIDFMPDFEVIGWDEAMGDRS